MDGVEARRSEAYVDEERWTLGAVLERRFGAQAFCAAMTTLADGEKWISQKSATNGREEGRACRQRATVQLALG